MLQKSKNVICNSWPKYKANLHHQEELTVHRELIFKQDKVVIPMASKAVKKPANKEPPRFCSGQTPIKRLSKWLKHVVSATRIRNGSQKKNTLKPHPWIGADIFTFHWINYLIIVDFYSGWFELELLNDTTMSTVILKLKLK